MLQPSDPLIMVLNSGSSSLKLAALPEDRLELRAGVERTNHTAGESRLWLEDGNGRELLPLGMQPTADRSSVLRVVLDTLATRLPGRTIAAIGHRVVHGGDRFAAPIRVTSEVFSELDALAPSPPCTNRTTWPRSGTQRVFFRGCRGSPASTPRSTPRCRSTSGCSASCGRTSIGV